MARDRPADIADIDRYFYGERHNPCRSRREVMEKYIKFLESVYPRRCCDDIDIVSLGMAREMPVRIIHSKICCSVCQEFRGQEKGEGDEMSGASEPQKSAAAVSNNPLAHRKQGGRRSRRHAKYDGAKVVSRIVDRALAPTQGILAGEPGHKAYRRTAHELRRDKTVRNCGPGYVLWKAMRAVPDDVWDKPFVLADAGKATTYYPSK